MLHPGTVTAEGIVTPGVLSLDLKTALRVSNLAKWQQEWDHTQEKV